MSKATYWQQGNTIDYTNGTASVIEANTIISLGTRIGVAGTAIKPNELGQLHVAGVFIIPKAASEAIALGAAVYFNGNTITTTASGNTPAGYAAAAALAEDANVRVKLLG